MHLTLKPLFIHTTFTLVIVSYMPCVLPTDTTAFWDLNRKKPTLLLDNPLYHLSHSWSKCFSTSTSQFDTEPPAGAGAPEPQRHL